MELHWYAVRCVFRSAWAESDHVPDEQLYEERITLWQARSLEDAIALAEAEAEDYAGDEDEYLDMAQAYQLPAAPGQGTEVFSLMRTSVMEPDAYLDTFFDTGAERQQVLD
ncbi:MAG: hypothetical protein JWN55_2037 [Frankiales bacterium]|jgi:hypothetical protein|nr:hypothetical protein [Frankiales bacterium]